MGKKEIKGSNLRLTLELSFLEIEGRLVFLLGGHPAYIFKKELARVKRRFDPFISRFCPGISLQSSRFHK